MTDSFLTFQKFPTQGDAVWMLEIFKAEGIEYVVENGAPPVDVTFVGQPLQQEILLKVKQADFSRAHAALEAQAESVVEELDGGYYLFAFETEELEEVLIQVGSWSHLDAVLARKLLHQRGISYTDEELESKRAAYLRNIRATRPVSPLLIVAGYFMAIMGGFGAFFYGYHLKSAKKTDPTGKLFYMFDANTRQHGKRMFWLGAVMWSLWMLVFMWFMLLRV